MAKSPCPEGQTRNAKTKACREKLKTGRKATRKASANKGKNWTNLAGLKANINARTAAAIAKLEAKAPKHITAKAKAKGKNWTNLNAVKANINARTKAAIKKLENKTRKSPKRNAAIIAGLNAHIAAMKKKYEGKVTRPHTA